MKMKPILLGLLICLSLGRAKKPTKAEIAPEPANMVELLATPERLNGKLVTVIAYLVIWNKGVNGDSRLCLSREDEENLLGNCIMVVPSQSMLRRWEELNGMYVRITGVIFFADRGPSQGRSISIQDIRNCTTWSDPKHPRGLYPFPLSPNALPPGARPR